MTQFWNGTQTGTQKKFIIKKCTGLCAVFKWEHEVEWLVTSELTGTWGGVKVKGGIERSHLREFQRQNKLLSNTIHVTK